MEKISKEYWGKEILLCGCEKKDMSFYKMLYKQFTANGVEVFALPTKPEADSGFQTYPDLAALPHVPECAYVMNPKEELPAITEELRQLGVRKILLYNKKKADASFVADCEKNEMEVRAGCPLMLYSGGPCALHAVFGGVREERKKY